MVTLMKKNLFHNNFVKLLERFETKLHKKYLKEKNMAFYDVKDEVNKLCSIYILEYFKKMGINTSLSAPITKDKLIEDLCVTERYRKLIDYALFILCADNFIYIE